MKITNQMKTFFESLAALIYRRPWMTIGIILFLSLGLISQLPKIKIDTTTEGFFHEEDPVLIKYKEFQEQFGRDDMIVVAIKPPEVFNFGFLKKLKDIHEEIENNVPNVADVKSLINARSTIGRDDELIVEDLLENWPKSEGELANIKRLALANPLYKNILLSEDGKFTTITVEVNSHSMLGIENETSINGEGDEDAFSAFEDEDDLAFSEESASETSKQEKQKLITDEEITELIETLLTIVDKHRGPKLPIYLGGSPVLDNAIKNSMQKDMGNFMVLSILVIAIFLFILFRRVSGVLLPLFVVVISLLATLALMAICGAAIKVPTQILPSFLLAVGVGDSVHVLTIFYRRLKESGDKKSAIISALSHSGRAITLTSLTTAGGLLSFISSDLAPITDLGIFAPIGVMLTLVYTVILLPALLAVIPVRIKTKSKSKAETKNGVIDRCLTSIGNFSVKYPKRIVIGSAVLIVLSIFAAFNIKLSYNPITWLPDGTPVKEDTFIIDKELKGSLMFEVLADTGIENGWHNPELLKKLEQMGNYVKQFKEDDMFVGQVVSITDVLKEINQALNENRHEFYSIPEDKSLVAQEFLIFENSGSEDLEDAVDSQFSKARFTMKLPALDAVEYASFLKVVEKRFSEVFGEEVDITITGIVALLFKTINEMLISMTKSYVIAIIVISILMVFLIGNLKIGLISMFPNLTPIIFILGIMGLFNFPLDAFTLLIGSIALGLVVDDTIHFMDNFRQYHLQTNNVAQAIQQTLQTTGHAMLYTSLVLSSGFFIYICSSMTNLVNFGLLTGLSILLALVADFILLPALLVLVVKDKK